MKFSCTIARLPSGLWAVHHESADMGHVQATAATRADAIDKMRGELRYRLELCPCSGESYQYIEVEIVEPPRPGYTARNSK
jgi:hypothetical protein